MNDEAILSLEHRTDDVERRFFLIKSRLAGLLPGAQIEHVGSTAVPGCLTKGDLDVLARVPADEFHSAVTVLDVNLTRSPRNDAVAGYVEYDWGHEQGKVSVQLVAEGSWHDRRFTGLRQALLADPQLVARYNQLKQAYAGKSMDDYRKAKHEFIDSILEPPGD